jgi:hypothetical protein
VGLSPDNEKRAKQLGNLKPFTGGDDPRRGTGKRRKPFLEAIEKYIEENPEEVAAAIKTAFAQTRKGNFSYLRELMDRVDGPVKQQVEHTGQDGGAIEHTIKFDDGKSTD